MVTSRLTLYDVVVDLVPGLLALGLAVLLLPPIRGIGGGNTPIGSAIFILAVGYGAGRSVHAVVSRPLFKDELLGRFDERVHRKLTDERTFELLRGSGGSEPTFRSWIESRQSVSDCGIDASITVDGVDSAAETIGGTSVEEMVSHPDVNDATGESENKLNEEDDLEFLNHYLQTELFPENSLYQRYNVLTTFYRNLWFVVLLFGIVYLVSGADYILYGGARPRLAELTRTSPESPTLSMGVVLLTLSTVLGARRLEFKYRQVRTFINEVHIRYGRDETVRTRE